MFLDGVDELGSDGKQDGFWTRDSSDACCFNDKSQAQKVRDQLRLKDAEVIQLPSAWCG
jgi:hypothetical protein